MKIANILTEVILRTFGKETVNEDGKMLREFFQLLVDLTSWTPSFIDYVITNKIS